MSRRRVVEAGRISLDAPWPPHASLRAALTAEKKRTGLGAAALLSGGRDRPMGLTGALVESWIGGKARTARRDYVDYILRCWAEASPVVRIPPDMRRALRRERERTGVGAGLLLRKLPNAPRALSAPIILAWMNGRTRAARQDHLDFILEGWRALPDFGAEGVLQVRGRRRPGYVALTEANYAALHAEFTRTGMRADTLLRNAGDAPPGLSSAAIRHWHYRSAQSALPAHLDYVMSLLRALPDGTPLSLSPRKGAKPQATPKWEDSAPRPQVGRESYIAITSEMRDALRSERERTGITPGQFLRLARDPPAALDHRMLQAWLSGAVRSADPGLLQWALAHYRSLPSSTD